MGNKLAVLAGDFLLSRACVELASLKNTEVVSLLAMAVENLVTGETMKMTTSSDQRCSMKYYIQKTYYKTASLISNSCKSVALLAGQTTNSMLAYDYGKNLINGSFPFQCQTRDYTTRIQCIPISNLHHLVVKTRGNVVAYGTIVSSRGPNVTIQE